MVSIINIGLSKVVSGHTFMMIYYTKTQSTIMIFKKRIKIKKLSIETVVQPKPLILFIIISEPSLPPVNDGFKYSGTL